MKRVFRYFGGFLDTQENWLNRMAQKGYRLMNTGILTYDFEECRPGEYAYAVAFVAQHDYAGKKDYRGFLESLGYNVFYKNMNLNLSVGKIRWRPYGAGTGQFSTNPGSYNKELLIVEKKSDGKPFALATTNTDKANYYKPLRNTWLTVAFVLLAMAVWRYIDKQSISHEIIAFGALGLISLIPALRYQTRVSSFTRKARIEE